MKKSNLEETKQKCRLGTASNEITGGLQLVFGRPTLALRVEEEASLFLQGPT